jgi:hypothetical protein
MPNEISSIQLATQVVTFRTQRETRNCELIFNYCTSIHCGDSENKRIKELEQLTPGNKFDDETAAVQVPSVIFPVMRM